MHDSYSEVTQDLPRSKSALDNEFLSIEDHQEVNDLDITVPNSQELRSSQDASLRVIQDHLFGREENKGYTEEPVLEISTYPEEEKEEEKAEEEKLEESKMFEQ